MRRILITALFVLSPVQATPQTARGSIEGSVVRFGTNQPLAGARVKIGKSALPPSLTIPLQNVLSPLTISGTEIHAGTDREGRYVFSELDPGDYIVTTEADGYSNFTDYPAGPTRYSDSAKRVTIRSGDHLGNLSFSLVRLATISGVVRSFTGQALSGIDVTLGKIDYYGGRRAWDSVNSVQTNDNGEYQFSERRPGEYYIAVTSERDAATEFPPEGRNRPFLAAYFPDALSFSSAVPIPTDGSDVRADITLPKRPADWRMISGKVVDGVLVRKTPAPGEGPASGRVSLIPRGENFLAAPPLPYRSGPIGPSGDFQISDVAPGKYDLYAHLWQGSQTYLGHTVVDVSDRDLTGLSFAFNGRSADLIWGRIVDENGQVYPSSITPELRPRSVMPFFLNDGYVYGEVNSPDRSAFEFVRVPPGTYDLVHIDQPSGAYVADIRQGGESVIDSGLIVDGIPPGPIEVMLRHDGGGVRVRVQGERGATGLLVLVPDAPQRENRLRYQDINVTAPTSFTFENVNPGSYKVFAIESWMYDAYQNAYLNADFLAKYEDQGVPVKIQAGQTANIRINLVRK